MSFSPYAYDYHEYLIWKAEGRFCVQDTKRLPMTEKEQKDLELLNLAKHYSLLLRKKIWFNET
jgi:hypothetical protein